MPVDGAGDPSETGANGILDPYKIVSSSEEVSETGGLRVVAERAGIQTNFQLSVVPLPAEDDEVIEEEGALVFLEPEAASLLDDKVLDARVEQDQVAFTIADQI